MEAVVALEVMKGESNALESSNVDVVRRRSFFWLCHLSMVATVSVRGGEERERDEKRERREEVRDGRKQEGEEDIHVCSIDFITCNNFAKPK